MALKLSHSKGPWTFLFLSSLHCNHFPPALSSRNWTPINSTAPFFAIMEYKIYDNFFLIAQKKSCTKRCHFPKKTNNPLFKKHGLWHKKNNKNNTSFIGWDPLWINHDFRIQLISATRLWPSTAFWERLSLARLEYLKHPKVASGPFSNRPSKPKAVGCTKKIYRKVSHQKSLS